MSSTTASAVGRAPVDDDQADAGYDFGARVDALRCRSTRRTSSRYPGTPDRGERADVATEPGLTQTGLTHVELVCDDVEATRRESEAKHVPRRASRRESSPAVRGRAGTPILKQPVRSSGYGSGARIEAT
jgi:hypothetical protein